ncbi:MAG: T9SS type A sorting domain-containing protein, partial [Gemmatimonadetes bacterium]|nr:T9SS type A sorting domain-containing protein [Gemmatimonadota bacterium]
AYRPDWIPHGPNSTYAATSSSARPPSRRLPIVVADAPTALPDDFALLHNFPNPFNAETQIAYRLPREARVRLTVFNAIGQPVRQLVNARQAAGTHSVTWDGQDDRGSPVATGIYFYRFAAGPFYQVRPMVLLK